MNLYGYANQDPVNLSDPLGLNPMPWGTSFGFSLSVGPIPGPEEEGLGDVPPPPDNGPNGEPLPPGHRIHNGWQEPSTAHDGHYDITIPGDPDAEDPAEQASRTFRYYPEHPEEEQWEETRGSKTRRENRLQQEKNKRRKQARRAQNNTAADPEGTALKTGIAVSGGYLLWWGVKLTLASLAAPETFGGSYVVAAASP